MKVSLASVCNRVARGKWKQGCHILDLFECLWVGYERMAYYIPTRASLFPIHFCNLLGTLDLYFATKKFQCSIFAPWQGSVTFQAKRGMLEMDSIL